jgi:hypothetical protein
MARSKTLQSEAGYIDARPLTTTASKSSCYARPDHTFGSSDVFNRFRLPVHDSFTSKADPEAGGAGGALRLTKRL